MVLLPARRVAMEISSCFQAHLSVMSLNPGRSIIIIIIIRHMFLEQPKARVCIAFVHNLNLLEIVQKHPRKVKCPSISLLFAIQEHP